MRIKRITVKDLFGMFCHEIPLNMDEHITIIHGPNGIGKTILLKMLNALFKSSYEEFRNIPFSELSVDFDDGNILRLKKEIKPGVDKSGEGSKLIFEFENLGSKLKSYTIKFARPQEVVEGSSDYVEMVAKWVQMDVFGNPVNFRNKLPQKIENEPGWLKDIQKSIRIRFIETQRLISFPDSRSRRKYEELPRMIPTVLNYSEELANAIQKKLAESAELSQSLDRTFPTRLVKVKGSSKPTIDELRDDLSKLEEKRSRLVAAGLLDRGEEIDFKDQDIDESNRNVLSVYIDDGKEKLKVFDELTDKIDLLVKIVNSRFLYKKMSISKKEGFIFETSDGQSISPTDLSSGEQHELVLNYELLFKVDPDSLILIDEPELSLHVIWQQQFLKDLQEIIKLAGFDVLLATHAPDIIHDRWDLTVELGGSTK